MRSHYEVLGVGESATAEEIHAAWRGLVSRYHPDRHSGNPLEDLAQQRIAEINAAWDVLSDPQRRARYDAELVRSRARAAGSPRPAPGVDAPTAPGMFQLLRRVRRLVFFAFIALLALRLLPAVARGLGRGIAAVWGTPVPLVLVLLLAGGGITLWRKRRMAKRPTLSDAGTNPSPPAG